MISSALGMAKTAEEQTLLLHVYERQVTDINQTLDAMQSLGASASTLEQLVNSLAQIAPELMVGVGSTGKISLNSKQIGFNEEYQPNAGAVGNMKEFLNAPGFGQDLASSSQRTHKIVQGETVYKANKPIGDHIETGDQFYLDKAHKNHIEVFGRNNKVKAVLNLDGSYNETKTAAAKAQGRTIPNNEGTTNEYQDRFHIHSAIDY